MPKSHVVAFPRLSTIPDPRPAKATLRSDVRVSVQRSIDKLPVLGQRNPDAALLIERSIDDYMPPPNDDGGHDQLAHATRELECVRQIHADFQRVADEQYRCLMDMLRDMSGDLSAAS
jgi:hypothetical protein